MGAADDNLLIPLLMSVDEDWPFGVRVHQAHDEFNIGKCLHHCHCIAQISSHMTQCRPTRWMHPGIFRRWHNEHFIVDDLHTYRIIGAECTRLCCAGGVANIMKMYWLLGMVAAEL